MPTPRTVVAAAVVALCISCACAAVREIPFPKKVEAEWQDWHDAFSATAVDGVVQRASIPALFREHFTLVHASLPGHEAHSELTKEDESIFQDEAQQFERFLAAQVRAAALAISLCAGFVTPALVCRA